MTTGFELVDSNPETGFELVDSNPETGFELVDSNPIPYSLFPIPKSLVHSP